MFKKYVLLLLSIITFHAYAQQQPTREQLLKLFYEAHAAQKNNDVPKALSSYKQILKLSPGLPDPYLQLGNLYATMTDDPDALQKACICYDRYLYLKADAADASTVQEKRNAIAERIQAIEKSQETVEQIAENAEAATVIAEETVPEPVVDNLAQQEPVITKEEIPAPVEVETKPIKVDSVETEPIQQTPKQLPIVPSFIGRWASNETDLQSGREMWILDCSGINGEMFVQLNDSAYIAHSPLFSNKSLWSTSSWQEGDNYVFHFEAEESNEQQEKDKSLKISEFESLISDLFNVNWKSLSPNLSKKESQTQESDTAQVDSTQQEEPRIIHIHEFHLKMNGAQQLVGTYHQTTRRSDMPIDQAQTEVTPIELFKAPEDYTGFSYTPISEKEKESRREFRILLNEKTQEAVESTSALNDLGCLYASGVGIHKNMKMAVAYYMEAAMKNNLFAKLNLAQLYATGMGVEKDLEKARDLYRQAYDSGYTDAMVLCGDTYMETAANEEDYKNALICYQKAVFKNCPYAAFRLGWLYKEGLGVEQNAENALKYINQAVGMQYADAMAELGALYRKGELVEQDFTKALSLLQKASAKGNAKAMNELSQMYLRGEGVDADFKLSKEWLAKYMEANDPIVSGFHTLRTKLKNILTPKP